MKVTKSHIDPGGGHTGANDKQVPGGPAKNWRWPRMASTVFAVHLVVLLVVFAGMDRLSAISEDLGFFVFMAGLVGTPFALGLLRLPPRVGLVPCLLAVIAATTVEAIIYSLANPVDQGALGFISNAILNTLAWIAFGVWLWFIMVTLAFALGYGVHVGTVRLARFVRRRPANTG